VSDIFASLYGETYDTLYREKDYAGECRLVERLFREHSEGDVHTVLDLGCGTANHAIRFAEMGYSVTGVERSSAMLDRAREKAVGQANLELHCADVRNVELSQKYDAALLLFAVLGYQIEDEEVIAALSSARRHLKPGGLVVFDVWFGPGVLRDRPSSRFVRIPLESGELLRAATPKLDIVRQVCTVRYDLWRIDGARVTDFAQEEHVMRFFFPAELRLLLAASGLCLVRLSPFPEIDRDLDDETWNLIVVARAADQDALTERARRPTAE
jgi:SAM-dependent methyltransferase